MGKIEVKEAVPRGWNAAAMASFTCARSAPDGLSRNHSVRAQGARPSGRRSVRPVESERIAEPFMELTKW